MNLEERVELLEFQNELLYNGTEIDRFLFECKITKNQYHSLMNLMDEMSKAIRSGAEPHHAEFESKVYQIVPERDMDYHFCELFTKYLAEEGRWPEVFSILYSAMPKYKSQTP